MCLQNALGHNPSLQSAVRHKPCLQNALGHKLSLQNALGHNPSLQSAVRHNPCLQNALGHNLSLQNDVGHSPCLQNAVRHNPCLQNAACSAISLTFQRISYTRKKHASIVTFTLISCPASRSSGTSKHKNSPAYIPTANCKHDRTNVSQTSLFSRHCKHVYNRGLDSTAALKGIN